MTDTASARRERPRGLLAADSDGNLTNQVDDSGSTTSTYDGMGRLTGRSAPNGVNDTYGYDLASNLTSLINSSGATSYHYNTLNEIDQVNEPSGRIDILGYNAMGQQTNLWTNTGSQVSYSGTTVIPPASFATHTTTAYNAAGQINSRATTLASNNNNVFSSVIYSYVTFSGCGTQPANVTTDQIRWEYDYVRGLYNTFCYDNAGRLASATVNNVTTSYMYNADGAPTSGSLGSFTYNSADQITNSGYTYDGDGDLTATPAMTATYNSADQTTAVTPTGSTATTFGYTGTGQATRSSVTAPGVTTTFANGLLGIESQTATAGTTSFVRLPDGTPIEEVTASGAYYYISDNQGSVIGLADAGGTTHASYTYTPYGVQTATALNGSLPPNPLGYDGGYTDATTGLIHFGARYYNPAIGQWTQRDPSGDNLGYVFANSDPVNQADPNGHFSLSDVIPKSIQIKALSIALGVAVGALVDAIPGIGPTSGAIVGGCVAGIANAWLSNHRSSTQLATACGAGAAYGALAGVTGQVFKNTVIPLIVQFVQKYLS